LKLRSCALLALGLACLGVIPQTGAAERPVRVFAAASLTNALGEIAAAWQKEGHPQPVLAFGASSTLAKQIDAGAPADVYFAADERWMDFLAGRSRIDAASRGDLLGNSLVLVAPRGRGFAVELRQGFPFAKAFAGRLCIGEPNAVPAGTYARAALQSLGFWSSVEPRIVGTDDVRAALAFVERGECAAGIVYATDAAISDEVEVLASFPAGTHPPIVYPAALVVGARPEAHTFLEFVRTAPIARRTFERFGFVVPAAAR
jgi:molybdate transport system substrate-binding protein